MSGFVERVSQYQVVEEGCKAASAAYQNIKSNEHLGTIFAKVESAATSLAAIMKPVLDSRSELSQKLPTATIASTLSQVISVLTFACDTAKSVSFPIILHGLDTIREQTDKLDKQLKEKGTLNWLDLQNVLQGLDKLRTYLEEQPKLEQLELQEIPSHSTDPIAGAPCTAKVPDIVMATGDMNAYLGRLSVAVAQLGGRL
ncbi:hypothetical protein T265_03611 [Opisthorchis viverrini]|uniref:Uncharacterized protein n=1 Tax=Opisthorchis viverrini TaxID=6198 RepID=A0A074ZVC4_OPIVI|nr:hypothetical protein T265_03611 [Opisthorchis viverrini]KER29812.1 hypothetical protein T265_03611 [Opisthorchis viverrini]